MQICKNPNAWTLTNLKLNRRSSMNFFSAPKRDFLNLFWFIKEKREPSMLFINRFKRHFKNIMRKYGDTVLQSTLMIQYQKPRYLPHM